MEATKSLEQKFDSFLVLYNVEKENERQRMKDFKLYLEKDVSRALNGLKDMREQITKNAEALTSLQLKDASCPIFDMVNKVKVLEDETRVSRAAHKYPEIQKGLEAHKIVWFITGVVAFAATAVTIIYHWKQIFSH
jgi:hypothetical protein